MRLHDKPFRLRQLPGFLQDSIADTYFPDVMHAGGNGKGLHDAAGEADHFGQGAGEKADPGDMRAGFFVPGLGSSGQSLDNLRAILLSTLNASASPRVLCSTVSSRSPR